MYELRLLTREEFERNYILASCTFLETVYASCYRNLVIFLLYTIYTQLYIRVYRSYVS